MCSIAQRHVHKIMASRNTESRARCWSFTLNNHTDEDVAQLHTSVFPQCDKYVVQEEVGEGGTPHLQGFLHFKSGRTFTTVKKLLPSAHIEVARNRYAAAKYCEKTETSTGRRWKSGYEPKKRLCRDPLADKVPYPWQDEILHLIETEPDDRTIHWYWEPEGCSGKTTLAKHICLTHPSAIYVCGKANDMKFAIMESKEIPTICIVDFVRSSESFVSYQGLEELKNGIFFSGKYKSGMKIFNPPHMIVLANFPPDSSKMSADRWAISKITPPRRAGTQELEGASPPPVPGEGVSRHPQLPRSDPPATGEVLIDPLEVALRVLVQNP